MKALKIFLLPFFSITMASCGGQNGKKQELINHINDNGGKINISFNVSLENDKEFDGFEINYVSTGTLDVCNELNISFGDKTGIGYFFIFSGRNTNYSCAYNFNIINHKLDSFTIDTIGTNVYPITQASTIRSIIENSAKIAIDETTTYLENHNLPYIF